MLQRLFSGLIAVTAAALIASSPATAQEAPTEVVQKYYDVLHEAMRNAQELGFEGRYDLIRPTIEETFHLPYIAEFSVGRYWDRLGQAERQRLIDSVAHLSTATYAARFDDYSGEQFEVVDSRETKRGDLLVLTNIIDSKGKPIGINYVMRQVDGQWRIIDVYLKGTYSELSTRRSEFTSVIRRDGFDRLIAVIDEKVDGMKAGA